MKYIIISLLALLTLSCSKEKNEIPKSREALLLMNQNWNRVAMITNPVLILPKQDGSGEFVEVQDLMDLKDL